MQKKRPSEVTPIGVLDIIGDSIYIIGGIVLFIGIPNLTNGSNDAGILSNSFAFELLTSAFGFPIAAGLTALGIVSAGAGIGLLLGKQWAWNMTVILAIMSAAIDIIILVLRANTASLISSIIGCVIDGIILFYLFRPHMKAYYGKTS